MTEAALQSKLPHVGQSMEALRLAVPHVAHVRADHWRHDMKGSTLSLLEVQWGRAMLDGDFDMVERIDHARRLVERLPVRRPCVWASPDSCRHCEAVCRMMEDAA